ncbi:MAG: helix-turn-helix domain-containing protein [Eubacteriales bacterium]|nr:helix-turn-helix domain-containing protein [Eubacteriales bacterium]
MSFGTNLQYLRSMHDAMTQEKLAEKMNVSRQTVSKWEQDEAYPAIEKLMELCDFFSCTMDQILRTNLSKPSEAYSDVRIETLDRFRLARHAVISVTPEDDAMLVMKQWAEKSGLAALPNSKLDMIGWDFPLLSQEQINVFNMHGYVSACVIPADFTPACEGAELVWQEGGKYAVISIMEPFRAAFELIPNAYQTMLRYIKEHGYSLRPENARETFCFERIYVKEGVEYMDVFIALA